MLQNLEPHQKVRNLLDIIASLLKPHWKWPKVDLSLLNVVCLYNGHYCILQLLCMSKEKHYKHSIKPN